MVDERRVVQNWLCNGYMRGDGAGTKMGTTNYVLAKIFTPADLSSACRNDETSRRYPLPLEYPTWLASNSGICTEAMHADTLKLLAFSPVYTISCAQGCGVAGTSFPTTVPLRRNVQGKPIWPHLPHMLRAPPLGDKPVLITTQLCLDWTTGSEQMGGVPYPRGGESNPLALMQEVRVCVCACVRACVCACVRMRPQTHTTHVHTHTHPHADTRTPTHTQAPQAHTHTHTHAHTHKRTHKQTHNHYPTY